jgi:3-oxoacyl-(acyl-carrier-protein) synthase
MTAVTGTAVTGTAVTGTAVTGIAVTGIAALVLGPGEPLTLDPRAFLVSPKSRKYMGVQDDLAVVAAGNALADAGLAGRELGERAGLYITTGYIPFNESDIAGVLEASLEDGRFSMARFAGGGFQRAHPLLTFRCLPNMPAYHVSVNFAVRGPYFVTYPGAGQAYLALEEARAALDSGEIDVALVMAVAHQRNFLVEHHFARIDRPVASSELRDVGACLVIETAERARARNAPVRGALTALQVEYTPFDALASVCEEREMVSGATLPPGTLGPAALFCALGDAWRSSAGARVADRIHHRVHHRIHTRDGIVAASEWTSAASEARE